VAWPAARPAGAPGLRGSRADLRTALLTVLVLALSGFAAGGLWLWLAPRADYRVTATDIVPVEGPVSSELFMADDGVFVLLLAGLGLLAGLVAWRLRRRRGVPTLAALAAGMFAAGIVARQLGEWLGAGPTEDELAQAGTTVTTGLGLGATAALAVGPFAAVLVYLVATVLTSRDDLGRPEDEPHAGQQFGAQQFPGQSSPGQQFPGQSLGGGPFGARQQFPARPPLPPVPPPAPRA